MLSQADLNRMDAAIATVYNLQATIQQKSTGDSWTNIAAGVACMIIPATSTERAKSQDAGYSQPLDSVMRMARNDAIKSGMRVVVTQVQGQTATGAAAATYQIIAPPDDLLSFGRQMELKLARVDR